MEEKGKPIHSGERGMNFGNSNMLGSKIKNKGQSCLGLNFLNSWAVRKIVGREEKESDLVWPS